MLWAGITIAAAAAQTLRNALQHDLTAKLGTLGATHVRFLFGLPFGVLFLTLVLFFTGDALPMLSPRYLGVVALGSFLQIAATALMLASMKMKSFTVTTAYTKTEPVQVALFGLVFLGEALTWPLSISILLGTFGVVLLAWPKAQVAWRESLPPALLGITAGACFALAAVCFRAGIISLPTGHFTTRASTTLAISLFFQASALSLYLFFTDRNVFAAIFKLWRPSLLAGFMGAAASQGWFLGFALTTAARVRTLGLVEVLFAKILSGKLFSERLAPREILGLILVVLSAVILLNF